MVVMTKNERPRASVVVTAYLPHNAEGVSPPGGEKEIATERGGQKGRIAPSEITTET